MVYEARGFTDLASVLLTHPLWRIIPPSGGDDDTLEGRLVTPDGADPYPKPGCGLADQIPPLGRATGGTPPAADTQKEVEVNRDLKFHTEVDGVQTEANGSLSFQIEADKVLTQADGGLRLQMQADEVQTTKSEADEVLTEADEVLTEADEVLTEADEVLTEADEVLTEADEVLTEADDVLTEADEVLTEADEVLMEADRGLSFQTEADKVLSEVDGDLSFQTEADQVQTEVYEGLRFQMEAGGVQMSQMKTDIGQTSAHDGLKEQASQMEMEADGFLRVQTSQMEANEVQAFKTEADEDLRVQVSQTETDKDEASQTETQRGQTSQAETDGVLRWQTSHRRLEETDTGEEDVTGHGWRSRRKHVFVLSEAGKPIYSLHGSEEALSATMGVMAALVSFVQAGGDHIRSIHADDYQVVFSQLGPLVLVSVSHGHQSETHLRRELLYVYHQIVSLLTRLSLVRLFQRKQGFDLRRLLSGSEKLLDRLLQRLGREPGSLLGAVQCLRLPASIRRPITQLLRRAATPDLILSLLVSRDRLVSLVQGQALLEDLLLDPLDLHLLLNLLAGSGSFRDGEVWAPVCLPGLCPDAYFYAYVSYLHPSLCLLLVSTDKGAFYSVSACKRLIEEGLRERGLLQAVAERSPHAPSPGIPDLWHFIYKPLDVPEKHRQLTQYTSPEIQVPYTSEEERQRLFDLYQNLHGRVHSSTRPLRLIYRVAKAETLLAWVTSRFELYACFSPLVSKGSAIQILTQLLHWLKREEGQLFIQSPPKYSPALPRPSEPILSLL